MSQEKAVLPRLDSKEIEAELNRVTYKGNYRRVMRNTILALIVVIAAVVLIAVLVMPVLRITGNSMSDTLHDGNIVLAVNEKNYETGDVIAFYYNNDIFVKRVIASAGDWVDIDEEGNVSVNGKQIEEPYITEKALGECNIKLPYQVPDGRFFVMGDHRAVSVDSRNTAIGCVNHDMAIGKLLFCVWPMSDAGIVQ